MSLPAPNGGVSGGVVWRFLVDENLPRVLAKRLRAAGFFAEDVRDVGLQHRPDTEVWAYVQAHQETLITEDKGIANTRNYPPPHAGIVVSDSPDILTIATQIQLLLDGLASLVGQSLANAVITISPGRVRVRR
jgi:predicted nuclease of predicted toxin-antitoxin system